ncbi:hypothetical protein [Helicobacter pylori]|uniref:Uncharacterized protein n=1 Tax=Helicobacter pylori SouthAfrica20 TaxID=1352356 RepID=T1UCG4_HELPX|nr:hypothetical protein [Helicobacter pylori]AGT74602.1 hypothetical protein HPSA20_1391 [Helicobacter pylori SouthAfrica20]
MHFYTPKFNFMHILTRKLITWYKNLFLKRFARKPYIQNAI